MFDAFHIAATGMNAQQQNVDAVANNLANVNTTGFKKSRVTFFDLVARDADPALALAAERAGELQDAVRATGVGVGISSVAKLFDAGDIKRTDSPFDIAIGGDGFLEVTLPDGTRAYTRGGTMKVNAEGLLSTLSGHPLKPGIAVPENATGLAISVDGQVSVQMPGQATPVEIGRLELMRFTHAAALEALGDNLYRPNAATGEPIAGRATDEGFGSLRQGHLEGSNVKMVEEMVNLMVAQRAYEANVKVVQAADEMLGMVNSMRR